MTDMIRKYGYVETGGSGNLLICRNYPLGQYKVIGVCIDEVISNQKGQSHSDHTISNGFALMNRWQ